MNDNNMTDTATIDPAMIDKIHAVVKMYINMYKEFFNVQDVKMPVIQFDLTGNSAGICMFKSSTKECILRFNAYILKNNYEDFIREIVPHEVAHFCSDHYYGIRYSKGGRIKHHDDCWKSMMISFGAKPNRCHTMKTKIGRRLRQFEYTCKCGVEHTVSTIIHNRLQKGKVYICTECKSKLTFVKELKSK
jgi:SprT protein